MTTKVASPTPRETESCVQAGNLARVFLGAALLAASLPLTLWLLVYTTVPISGD